VIFLHIDNPSPVPSRFWAAFSSSLLKSIKRFLIPSSEMPPPLSMILIWKQMSASFLEGKRIDSKDFSYGLLHLLWIYYSSTLSWILIVPLSEVNFIAFERKLNIIYRYRCWSPQTQLSRCIFSEWSISPISFISFMFAYALTILKAL
jgi:hypothetical protein